MGSANPIEAKFQLMEQRVNDVTNQVHAILRELVSLNELMMEMERKYHAFTKQGAAAYDASHSAREQAEGRQGTNSEGGEEVRSR